MKEVTFTKKTNLPFYALAIAFILALSYLLHSVYLEPELHRDILGKALFTAIFMPFMLGGLIYDAIKSYYAPNSIVIDLPERMVRIGKSSSIPVCDRNVIIKRARGRLSIEIYQQRILKEKFGFFYVSDMALSELEANLSRHSKHGLTVITRFSIWNR